MTDRSPGSEDQMELQISDIKTISYRIKYDFNYCD